MSVTSSKATPRLLEKEIEDLRFVPIAEALEKIGRLEPEKLLANNDKLCRWIATEGGVTSAYTGVKRTVYVAMNVQLNKFAVEGGRRVQAPAFRSRLPLVKKPSGNEKQLSNDTQVLDLHYLWLKGHRSCKNAYGRDTFSKDAFGFDSALRFVRTAGGTKLKLEQLGLDETPGTGLCRLGAVILRTAEDKELRERIIGKRDTVRNSLETVRVPNGADKNLWTTLILADEALTEIGLKSDGHFLECMIGIISGEPSGPQRTLFNKLNSANNKLGRKAKA